LRQQEIETADGRRQALQNKHHQYGLPAVLQRCRQASIAHIQEMQADSFRP